MSSNVPKRRCAAGAGPILEWTLDGNIHYVNDSGRAVREWHLEVEGDVVDISHFSRECAEETLAPALEKRGFEVKLPESEPETDGSIVGRIKRLITG